MLRRSTAAALQMSAPARSTELESHQAEGLCAVPFSPTFSPSTLRNLATASCIFRTPPPTPNPSLPTKSLRKQSTLGLATLLSSVSWWPSLEHHRCTLKSAAQLQATGTLNCGCHLGTIRSICLRRQTHTEDDRWRDGKKLRFIHSLAALLLDLLLFEKINSFTRFGAGGQIQRERLCEDRERRQPSATQDKDKCSHQTSNLLTWSWTSQPPEL
ncbi:uncharacterized protein LOC141573164 isoform X1 [Rhinolophus sinicus]|uniref:uncharacterized protein LOC141573164 isoform X1 n=1 Tax=Rhinolophus sinicus TaxID=89399 RepID=UPI003D7A8986